MHSFNDQDVNTSAEDTVELIDKTVTQSDVRRGRTYEPDSPLADKRLVSDGKISIFSEAFLLPNGTSCQDLDYDSIVALSKYLCDLVIEPSATFAVTLDHFDFWRWTAAVASQELLDNLETGNFFSMVHFSTFPLRVESIPTSANSAVNGVLMRRWNIIQITLFPVLEGFLTGYTNVLTHDDNAVRATRDIDCTWAPPNKVDGWSEGDAINGYPHLLQIWRKYGAINESVTDALSAANDLSRYDMESIRWKFDTLDRIINEEVNDGTNNFLRLVGVHRNKDLHGETEGHIIAPILLTLCCIAILDALPSSNYEKIRRHTIDRTKPGLLDPGPPHPFAPEAFYTP